MLRPGYLPGAAHAFLPPHFIPTAIPALLLVTLSLADRTEMLQTLVALIQHGMAPLDQTYAKP